MDNAIVDKLERARKELLDLTTRNRLIDTKRTSTRSSRLEIVGESAVEIYRMLIDEKRNLTFLPKPEKKETTSPSIKETKTSNSQHDYASTEHDVPQQPTTEESADNTVPIASNAGNDNQFITNQTDRKLQTDFTSDALQKKLLTLSRDARTYEEEQGVNTLYLAIGFLKWFDANSSEKERFAPLVLVPVSLERTSAQSKFRLAWREEEITTNLSLQEKMRVDFGIELPDHPDSHDLSLVDYFAEINTAIGHQEKWEVLGDDMVLWFYSFSKFLMYRDLLPQQWSDEQAIEKQALIAGMLGGAGFTTEAPICNDDENIDDLLSPQDMIHVMNADSSQTIAIEEVKQGRNLVIQGPPGTGKSQTIANMIATAVADGKKVLFVAEKMAALDVVKRRLDNIGLGEMCLELHSQKAKKKEVLLNLDQALNLGTPHVKGIEQQALELGKYRQQLNQHAQEMHTLVEPANVTPYHVLGQLVQLASLDIPLAPFELNNVLNWCNTDFQEHLNLIDDLNQHLEKIGLPVKHPWRGVQLQTIIPADVQQICDQVPSILERLDLIQEVSNDLSQHLNMEEATTPLSLSKQAVLAQQLLKAPQLDRNAIADVVWKRQRKQIDRVIEIGIKYQQYREDLKGIVTESAWSTSLNETQQHLKAYGKSWFRIFYKKYRNAQATLRGITVQSPPQALEERLQIVNQILEGQSAQQQLNKEKIATIGKRAFGTFWDNLDSNWQQLRAISDWEKECKENKSPSHFRTILANINDEKQLSHRISQVKKHLKPLLAELETLFHQLKFDIPRAFQVDKIKRINFSHLELRLNNMLNHRESLSLWSGYWLREQKLIEREQLSLANHLQSKECQPEYLHDQSKQQYYEQVIRKIYDQSPSLAVFNGDSHEQAIERFQSLDEERIALTRQEVAMAHFAGMPQSGMCIGEVATIRREISKKRGHLPLRKLLSKAGRAVQAIKPVFMMSPLSVAQFLEPGAMSFDLLLIDEASQVKPVDALGAIARATQAVIVGDDRQLPPTNFFDKQLGDREIDFDDENDDFQAGDMESILGLCTAQGMSKRMLEWHYRSRHHSLIAVSNREFYDNKLKVIPSPQQQGSAESGLLFHHLPNGTYDRGGKRTNAIEAEAVADAVIIHSQNYPHKTLGVGTFSVAQRDAILDQLELKRKEHPELEPFFSRNQAEPFFVKNLENIQGDERDVIFISVGYARDVDGYLAMSFGPLNREGGERRLNVLISRSRECCKVFSSITAEDIDLTRSKAFGVKSLKAFLKYAKTGNLDLGIVSGKEFDSEFELQVSNAISNHGYEVHPQVGVAGFFIDLAIVDPQQPGCYLLGIECDGASYHSSRSARDRDRIRQVVLEDRGWNIHRIWSTDWFQRPDEQLKKTLAAIEQAVLDQTIKQGHLDHATEDSPNKTMTTITRDVDIEVDAIKPDETQNGHLFSTPYVEADFQIGSEDDLHELSPHDLGVILTKIVEIEGPVHQEEIIRRATTLWGYSRAGNRISTAIENSLNKAVHERWISESNLFYSHQNQQEIPIRNRGHVTSTGLRKTEHLPHTEIQAALLKVVEAAFSISRKDAIREVARLLGFRSTSSNLSDVIEERIQLLVDNNELNDQEEMLSLETKISN